MQYTGRQAEKKHFCLQVLMSNPPLNFLCSFPKKDEKVTFKKWLLTTVLHNINFFNNFLLGCPMQKLKIANPFNFFSTFWWKNKMLWKWFISNQKKAKTHFFEFQNFGGQILRSPQRANINFFFAGDVPEYYLTFGVKFISISLFVWL